MFTCNYTFLILFLFKIKITLMYLHGIHCRFYSCNQKILDYFIIYRTFPQSAGISKINESSFILSNNKSTTMTIVNAMENFPDLEVSCIYYSKNGIWPIRQTKATILSLFVQPKLCLIITYGILCDQDQTKITSAAIRIKKSNPIQLLVVAPNKTKRSLVFCMSRMFFYVRWQLFIAAMELYRLQKVDLLIAYVLSVDQALYELMQIYEKDGFLQTRGNLEMPSIEGLDYNPNIEMEWNNQGADFHDCLYEFRESAEYLAFLDWDDILVEPNYQPLPKILNELTQSDKQIASLFIQRWQAYMQSLEDIALKNNTIRDIWNNGIIFDQSVLNDSIKEPDGKMIIRPFFIIRISLHQAFHIVNGYKEIDLSTKHLFVMHMKSLQPIVPVKPLIINSSLFEENFNKMVFSQNISQNIISSLFKRLPKEDKLFYLLQNCHWDIRAILKYILERNMSHQCPTIHQCLNQPNQMPHQKIEHKCVNNNNMWNIQKNQGNVFAKMTGNFFENSINCKYTYKLQRG